MIWLLIAFIVPYALTLAQTGSQGWAVVSGLVCVLLTKLLAD